MSRVGLLYFVKKYIERAVLGLQGGLDPNKISGMGTIFGLLVHALPGPNKRRVCKPIFI
jgi:hypothetical protein